MAQTGKITEGAEQEKGAPASRQTMPIEAPTDQYGNPRDQNLERYPDDSPAKKGETTPPSGQGGVSPHDGISHQDMFPPNPEPGPDAKAKGEENDRIAKGEESRVDQENKGVEAAARSVTDEDKARK